MNQLTKEYSSIQAFAELQLKEFDEFSSLKRKVDIQLGDYTDNSVKPTT